MTGPVAPRYLIRCRSGRHQVAVDPARFWRPARCPVCRSPVDALRLQRFWRWATGRAPRSRVRVGVLGEFTPLDGTALLTALGLGAVALGLRVFGDRWWVGTVALFLGRWPWLLPLGLLVPMALASRRIRTITLTAVAAAVGLFWIMGLSTGLGRLTASVGALPRIRVVTFNMAARPAVAARLPGLLAASAPDLLAIQECAAEIEAGLFSAAGYSFHRSLSNCLVSRWPVLSAAEQPAQTIRDAGGSGLVTRYRIDGPTGPFDITNVHLNTPRNGFEALLQGNRDGPELVRRGTVLRDIESRRARRWVDQGGPPRLVVGDFNTPEESVIFRSAWGDLTEAFDQGGIGFGFTRYNGWIRLRIDHVLAGPGFRVVRAEVLPDYGSDHRPLMAELVLDPAAR